jgi:hypothetical protein
MTKTVPVVKVRIVKNINPTPGLGTMGAPLMGLTWDVSHQPIAPDWIVQITMVP